MTALQIDFILCAVHPDGDAVRKISPRELHLLFSAFVTALFEPVIHRYSLDESMRCLETIEAFFLPGWKALFGF